MIPSPELRATGVGALPHRDPDEACRAVLAVFPEIPFIPTLPNRSLLETVVFADSEHLPGGVIREGRLTVDRSVDPSEAMAQVLLDYLEGNAKPYGIGEAYGSGFHAMMDRDLSGALLVKCQVTGPVTFGMQVVDETRRPILYDPEYADLLGKLLGLRARWCEEMMRERMGARATLVVLTEPYLASLGSAVVPVDPGVAASAFEDVAGLLEGGSGSTAAPTPTGGLSWGLRLPWSRSMPGPMPGSSCSTSTTSPATWRPGAWWRGESSPPTTLSLRPRLLDRSLSGSGRSVPGRQRRSILISLTASP